MGERLTQHQPNRASQQAQAKSWVNLHALDPFTNKGKLALIEVEAAKAKECPVYYLSRVITGPGTRYSVVEGHCLTLVFVTQKLRRAARRFLTLAGYDMKCVTPEKAELSAAVLEEANKFQKTCLQCQFSPCPAECALEHYIMKTGESPIFKENFTGRAIMAILSIPREDVQQLYRALLKSGRTPRDDGYQILPWPLHPAWHEPISDQTQAQAIDFLRQRILSSSRRFSRPSCPAPLTDSVAVMGEEEATTKAGEAVTNGTVSPIKPENGVSEKKDEEKSGDDEMCVDTKDDKKDENKDVDAEVSKDDKEGEEKRKDETKSEAMEVDGEENANEESEDKIAEAADLKEKKEDDKAEEKKEAGSKKRAAKKSGEEKGTGKKVTEEKKGKEKNVEPKTPVVPTIDRPVRVRKSVERLVEVIDDIEKEFRIEKVGRGTTLKDIPNVAKSEEIVILHLLLIKMIAVDGLSIPPNPQTRRKKKDKSHNIHLMRSNVRSPSSLLPNIFQKRPMCLSGE
ncbi:homeodomain-like, DEK [Artemisia annua]|uniref:Homeodomain-like, DEK n=1 Tax=Artemisia annua TaxID=35608 RepID=A0A2U1NDA1_ARTAN|nr:homeodomain-like, DEK [Artemisia annua]